MAACCRVSRLVGPTEPRTAWDVSLSQPSSGSLKASTTRVASSWDQRRGELSEQLGQVQTHLNTAVEGFRTTDTELAKALTDQTSNYPPRTAQPQ